MEEGPIDALCMACDSDACWFQPRRFQRRPLGDFDVLFDLRACGVCHSDLHISAGHMGAVLSTTYPCTPGHELAGVCVAVGPKVTKFQVGDHVGVGCLVDSCMKCSACKAGDEQKCLRNVGTYQAKDWSGRAATWPAGEKTIGGYSSKMVVTEHFGIKIPRHYPLECAGPVMCAGITMYDPLKKLGAGVGVRVGVVGLGGLGVMGVKIAAAMGCRVTGIGRSQGKADLALESGAATYIASSDARAMEAGAGSLDIILNTIPVQHDWALYDPLLAAGGKQVLLGLHASLLASVVAGGVTCGRSRVMASLIGGIANTQEVIDFCAKHDIRPAVEMRPVQDLTEIYEALDGGNDGGKRFVLDIAGSLNDDAFEICKSTRAPELMPNPSSIACHTVFRELFRMLFKACAWRPSRRLCGGAEQQQQREVVRVGLLSPSSASSSSSSSASSSSSSQPKGASSEPRPMLLGFRDNCWSPCMGG